ncbi:MarR family winged helix-turn-helix transcriptional regulator [Actinacidiphila epipremni]|uniref:MarR family transcriptional regulator n=1 Tax=Actinacidiphila epipremni TaxID=2053013 RepID=A0ABX0ZVE2_9ACTN|nr:MarR family transcriptional regulator [Actinacidiphila epipremni]NJP48003.1 MarR family transcriptional regulator [Actinacidiphila epipremni]
MKGHALSSQAAGAGMPPGLAGYAAYLLRRAYVLANRCAPDFDEAAEGAGSARDFQVLDALGEPGAAYSQQDLGDRLGINRTTMVKLIDRFEAAGQVVRTRNPDDRRSYLLALTEEGRAALKAMDPAISAADDKLTAGLSPAERERLGVLLAALLGRTAPPGAASGASGPAAAPAPDLAAPAPDAAVPGPYRRTGALITQAHHLVRHRIEAALADSGLQARHFGALTVLAEGACSQQQLARRLAISEQAVLQVVDDLEHAGHVARDRDPADRRRYALRITDRGHAALRSARAVVEATEAELGTTLGEQGRAELAGLLGTLLATAP